MRTLGNIFLYNKKTSINVNKQLYKIIFKFKVALNNITGIYSGTRKL